MAMEALGQLKSTEAVPIIEKRCYDPVRKIRFNARRVLRDRFGIAIQDDEPD